MYPIFFAFGWIVGRIFTHGPSFLAALTALAAVLLLNGCDDYDRALDRQFAPPKKQGSVPPLEKDGPLKVDPFKRAW